MEKELEQEATLEFEGSDGKRYTAKASETHELAAAAKAEGVTLKAVLPDEAKKETKPDFWTWDNVAAGVRGIWEDPTGEHGALAYMGLNAVSGLATAAGRVFKGIAQGAGDVGFGLARGIARGVETLVGADGHAVSGFLKDWHESYDEITNFLTPDVFEKRGMYDGIEGAKEATGAVNGFAEAVFGLKGMGLAAKGATGAARLAGNGVTAGKALRTIAAKAPQVGQAATAAGMGGKGYAEMAEDPEGPGGWRQELAAAAKGGIEAAMFGVLGPFKKMNMALPKPFEQLTKMEVVKRFALEAGKSGLMMGGVAAAKEGAEALATAGTDEHWHQKTAWEVAKTVMTEFAVGSAFHAVNAMGKTGEWLRWKSDRANGEGALSFRVEQNRKTYAPILDRQARMALVAHEEGRGVAGQGAEGTENVAALLPGGGVRFDDGSVWQLGADGRATITVADGTILDAGTGAIRGYRARREGTSEAEPAEDGTQPNTGGKAENTALLLDALERGELPTEAAQLEGLEITETSYQQGHVLDGEWDQAKAPPVIVWAGNDGTRVLITGRSRAAAAAKAGAKEIAAHVIREDQGWTREQAESLDALENMREGRGTGEEIARGVEALGIRSEEDCDRYGIVPERPVLDAIEVANEGSEALRGAAADGTVGAAWAAECARRLGTRKLGAAAEKAQKTAMDMIAGKLPPDEAAAGMEALAELAARKPEYTEREAAEAIREARKRAVGEIAVEADSQMVEMPDGSIRSVGEVRAEDAGASGEGATEQAGLDRGAEPTVGKDGSVGCARFPAAKATRTTSEDGRPVLLVEGITGEEMMRPEKRESAVQFLARLKEMAGDVDIMFAEVSAADAAEALLMAKKLRVKSEELRVGGSGEELSTLNSQLLTTVQAGQRLVDGLFGKESGIRVRTGTPEEAEAALRAAGETKPIKDAQGQVQGYYDRGKGEVVLFEGADAGTLAHEIGWHAVRHWAETNSPELLLKMNRYAARAPLELKAAIKEVYGEFTGDALMDEIGAGRFERAMGERFQKLLAKSPEVRGWWRKVLHALKTAWKGMASTVGGNRIDLKKLDSMEPEQAIEWLADQMVEGRRLGERGTRAEQEEDGKRLSLVGTRKDGIEVYESDAAVLKMPYRKRKRQFLDVMTRQYAGRTARFTRNGQTYYATFEQGDVRKNIHGDAKSDREGLDAKINAGASGDMFDLVENARYDHTSQETGKRIRSHSGVKSWDYFDKTVQIDNKVFDVVINVRDKGNEQFVYNVQLNRNRNIKPVRHMTPSPQSGTVLKSGATGSTAQSISQQGGGAQGEIRPSIKKRRDEVYEDVLRAVRAGGQRVAAGRSERTEAGFDAGANLYLEREGQAGPSQDGSMTLAYSEALRLYRALAASAHMPKVLEKMPWLASRDRKGRLRLNAAAFGIVDRSDLEAVKESLKKDGLFMHEDAAWRLNSEPEEVRAMEEMSQRALGEEMEKLAEARIKGKASGGGRTAVNILAKEIGRMVCELPATAGAPKSLKDLRALGLGIAHELGDPKGELGREAREAAKWWREQDRGLAERTETQSEDVADSELWAEMFGMFLADPVGLEAKAPKVYAKMVETIAGNEKLSEAWNALRRTRDAEGPHERVMQDIERRWAANEQEAYSKLLAELQKPIGGLIKRTRARLMLELHSTEGPAVMWVTDAVKERLAELKRLKKSGRIGEEEYDRLAGGAKRELEKMRVALLHKQRGGSIGRLYALDFAERIMGDVARDGVDMGDLRRYLYAKSVRDGRHQKGKAAALGMDQREADMVLRDMEGRLGADGWARLETAARRFQALREQHILDNEFVQEAFGRELVEYWRMNASYVRSERTWTPEEIAAYEEARNDWVKRHPGESDVIGEIEALMDMHVAKGSGTAGSAFLKPLVGSNKAVKDPLSATLENDLRIVEFAQRNHWACQLAECAEALKMDGFAVMEDRGGGGRLRGSERYGSVSFLKDGKRMTLVMPKVVAEGFEHDAKGVSKLVKLNRVASVLLTQYSLRFAWRNVIRNRESNNNNIAWMSEGRVVTALGAAGMRPIARWGTLLMEQAAAHLPDRFARNALMNVLYGKKTNIYWVAEATRLAKMMQDPKLLRQRAEEADRLAAQGKTAEAQRLLEDVRKCREFMKLPIFAGVRRQILGESGKTDLDELMRTLGMETNFDGTKLSGLKRVKRFMQRRAETVKRFNDFEEARVKLIALLAAQHEAELARAEGREAPRSRDEVTYQVATMSGSPRYENRGRAMNYIEFACGPFMNVGMKGAWRTVESMRYDPKAWWTKAAGRIAGRLATSVLWMGGGYRVLAEALREAAGDDEDSKKRVDGFERFGRRMAHALANVSDYRLRNYDIVPVGLYGKWSTLAISMPRGDEDRLLMPMVDLLANGLLGSERAQEAGFALPTDLNYTGSKAVQNMLLNSGLVPDLTKRGLLMSLFQDAIGPLIGWNPYNTFTQRTVYSKADFDSRFEDPGNMAGKVAKQLWNDIGGQVLMPATTWDEDEGAYEDQGQWALSMAEEGEAGCMPIGGKTIFQALHSIPFLSAAASGLVTMQNGGNERIARRLQEYQKEGNRPLQAVANQIAREVVEAVRKNGEDWDYSDMLEARVAELGLPEEDVEIIEGLTFRKVGKIAQKMGVEFDPIGEVLTKMATNEKLYKRALRQVEAEGWQGETE